jgi:hypothetical protein
MKEEGVGREKGVNYDGDNSTQNISRLLALLCKLLRGDSSRSQFMRSEKEV